MYIYLSIYITYVLIACYIYYVYSIRYIYIYIYIYISPFICTVCINNITTQRFFHYFSNIYKQHYFNNIAT